MKKIIIKVFLLIALVLSFENLFSQATIYSQRTKVDSIRPDRCINCKKFSWFYSGIFTSPISFSDELSINPASSIGSYLGLKKKYRINNYISTGYDLMLVGQRNNLRQKTGKTVPDTIINDKEILFVNCLGAGYYIRINFDKRRGNYTGHYLDIGGFGLYNYKRTHFTQNKITFETVQKIWYKSVPFIEKYQYGLYAKIGINKFVIAANYRLSSIFKSDFDYTELPRLSMGFEYSFY